MSNNPPVLHVDTPGSNTPTPPRPRPRPMNRDNSYFTIRTRTTASSTGTSEHGNTSPSMPGRSPAASGLLLTPPLPEASPRRNGSHSSSHGPRSMARHTPMTDNLSAASCRCPHHSPGASMNSSETGRSPCSGSSDEYLESPSIQGDTEKTPYKPRRRDSESLNMVHSVPRASAMPDNKKVKTRRRHRYHKCHHKSRNVQEANAQRPEKQAYWWRPGHQTVPTAPVGQKMVYPGHETKYGSSRSISRQRIPSEFSQADVSEQFQTQTLTRRWSSVESGAHQIILDTILPVHKPVRSKFKNAKNEDLFAPKVIGQPYRSSSFTRGAIEYDIIRALREKLTLRKLSQSYLKDAPLQTQLELPSSITLRRASGVAVSECGSDTSATRLNEVSGHSTPRPQFANHLHQRRPSAAYLITSRDIESITALIEANLMRRLENPNLFNLNAPNILQAEDAAHRHRKKTEQEMEAAADATQLSAAGRAKKQQTDDVLNYLQVSGAGVSNNSLPRLNRSKSSHITIWNGDETPASDTDEDDQKHSGCSTEPGSPHSTAPQVEKGSLAAMRERSDAFDPKNPWNSISEWSWRLPQNDISVVVTSSDSEPNDTGPATGATKSLARPANKSGISDTKDKTISKPKASEQFQSQVAARISASSRQEFKMTRGEAPKFQDYYEDRRKSVVKMHPNAPARNGERLAVGSSIGAHQGERRRSSAQRSSSPRLQRVKTIDNVHKGERDHPCTKWRKPSVCPAPKLPSPSEPEDQREQWIPGPETGVHRLTKLRNGLADGIDIMMVKSSPRPQVDCPGIYGMITIATKDQNGDSCFDTEHVCDDYAMDPRIQSSD